MSAPQPVYRKDYAPPAYAIETVDLNFDLRAEHTDVRAELKLSRTAD